MISSLLFVLSSEEVRRLQLAHRLETKDTMRLIVKAFIDTSDPRLLAFQAKRCCSLIAKCQLDHPLLIAALEELCSSVPALQARFPLLLKEFFDADILSDAEIIFWRQVGSLWMCFILTALIASFCLCYLSHRLLLKRACW